MTYRGHVADIPIGSGGLTGNLSMGSIPPNMLVRATNITYETGSLRKEGGSSKYNAVAITGAPEVAGGWDWWPSSGTQRMIVATSDGKLLRDDGAGTFGTTLKSGLNGMTTAVPVFVEGGKEAAAIARKLFVFTGVNPVQVLSGDGVTTTNISSGPADWSGASQPSFGLAHEGRLWGGGNANDPHRLYFSQPGNHENMVDTGAGSISVFSGEGEKLVGAVSFKGIIVAFKYPKGVYLVDTSDPTITNWRVTRHAQKVGGVSPQGAAITDSDVIWLDATGNFQLLSAVQEFGDVGSSSISVPAKMEQYVRDNMNLALLSQAYASYYGAKRELHVAMAGRGSTQNNARLVVDFNRGDVTRFRFSDKDSCRGLWLRKDIQNIERLTSGDYAGFVWDLDKANKSKDGVGYASEFQIPYLDFAWLDPKMATVMKQGQFLELVVEPSGNWNLFADIYWDGRFSQSVSFNMGVTGAALGSFTLGTDVLGSDYVVNRKRRITGGGRRFSAVCRNNGANEDFSVSKMMLHFTAGDEKIDV